MNYIKTQEEYVSKLKQLRKIIEELERSELNHKKIKRKPWEFNIKTPKTYKKLPQNVFYKNRNLEYTCCNDSYAKFLGTTSDQLVGKTDFDFFSNELALIYEDNEKRILETGQILTTEETYIQNGYEYNLLVVKTPIKNTTGETIGITGVMIDISEHRLTKDKLKAKTVQQEQLLETSKHLTSTLEIEEVLKQIGVSAKEILAAHGCAIYMLNDDKSILNPVIAIEPPFEEEILSTPLSIDASFTGQSVLKKEVQVFNNSRTSDKGILIPGTSDHENENIIAAPFIIDEEVIGAICLSRLGMIFNNEDINLIEMFATYASIALKNAQVHKAMQNEVEKHKITENELKRNELLLSEAQHMAKLGSWQLNADDKTMHWSNELYNLLGYNNKDIDICYENFVSKIDATEREAFIAALDHSIKTGERFEVNHKINKSENNIRFVHSKGFVRDLSDNSKQIVGISQDITKIKKMEDELRSSYDDLDKKVKARTALLRHTNEKLEQEILEKKKAESRLRESYDKLKDAHEEILGLERRNSALAMAVTANHEINQPLMVLSGSLELFQYSLNKKELNDKQKKLFGKMNQSLESIKTLLKKYRDNDTISFDRYTDNTKMVVFNRKDK